MLGWSANIWMAGGILAVALFLALWQRFDKRARRADVDGEDEVFFKRQDMRRWSGIGMMFLLAVAVFLVDPPETSPSPRSAWQLAQLANLGFLIVLVTGLLALALTDAIATLRYGRRRRRDLAHEHAKLMLEVMRRTGSPDSMSRVSEKQREAPGISRRRGD
jgi:O-antigen ligase